MNVTAIDFRDEPALLAAFDLETEVTRELRGPSWVPLPAQVRIGRWTNQPGFAFTLLAAWDGSQIVGLGERCVWENEPEDFFVSVHVAAHYRRRGTGTALLDALESRGVGPARRFLSEPSFHSREGLVALRDGFCGVRGYALGASELCMESILDAESIPPVALAPGWDVATFIDGIPDELLPEVGVIQGLVDEEAPSGDVDWSAHAVTPEDYHADLARVRAEGGHLIEAVAVTPGGRVAGWTAIATSPTPDRPARVPGTLVLEQFRGHGLGMALKSAVATAAVPLGVNRVATECDQENFWMLDINRRQGFVETGVRATFCKEVLR